MSAPTTIHLTSTNAHKLQELSTIFAAEDGAFVFAPPPRPLEVEETGETFAANALLKAQAAAAAFGTPCLADDSGLAVEALGGRPGVYSARYAATDAARIEKLLGELAGVPAARRGAAFVCAMALAWPDGRTLVVEGRCEGRITEAPAGSGGFGYDPVFLVPAHGRTFGELPAEVKHTISHRAQAAARLREALRAAARTP
ncbi:MAG: RdgB/HAM1 family non-canonical purine NTP pyrophosphatase [Candidatus Sericytochromatia bacterium]|nr:RdgB/HAM1 family non-canonical purine NTP pyrophosphatase [Candidatus Sericytochromatia bacterium]MEB3221367.1 RdgB/HAM1 family non-canonical purine NTP pyrophosphatase [Candidatus Sericytochromatia bacterium]